MNGGHIATADLRFALRIYDSATSGWLATFTVYSSDGMVLDPRHHVVPPIVPPPVQFEIELRSDQQWAQYLGNDTEGVRVDEAFLLGLGVGFDDF